MRRFLLPASVAAAALALLALLVFGVAGQGPDKSIDAAVARGERPQAPAASASLPVLAASGTQGTRRLADLRGKVVIVNVFASWCDPCKAEAPVLEQAARQVAGRNATVLGVTYLDNSNDSESFVRRQHISYPVVRDVSGDFVRAFGSTGVPETFVIDRRGRVAAVRRYQIDTRWLERTLPPLLAEAS
jgi:cytochrome c biogenesis protein CcmG/thiol:disulfide interchange protein DsbE